MAPSKRKCYHAAVHVDVSAHADEAGFARADAQKLAAAATSTGRAPSGQADSAAEAEAAYCFPAPLLLPGDDLALNPKYPAQSVRSWLGGGYRNLFTSRRKTIYVGDSPTVTAEMAFLNSWSDPVGSSSRQKRGLQTPSPKVGDVRDYLEAFYHGVPVKLLPQQFRYIKWDETTSKENSKFIGLQYGESCTRIRTRPCPDGGFEGQFNLLDVFDAQLSMLPDDAYALVLLVDQDLYEDEDDEFCCGRAFGGSRISIVSSARYHPGLDAGEGVDPSHVWPASHCRAYIDRFCGIRRPTKRQKRTASPVPKDSPILEAIAAAKKAPPAASDLHGLWFSRVARTVAHELGHCLGFDHCVYYACAMQGTASMAEDVRQPPYLCPVCLMKVTLAILDVMPGHSGEKKYQAERYAALAAFCERWKHVAMFAGFGAWIQARSQGSTQASTDQNPAQMGAPSMRSHPAGTQEAPIVLDDEDKWDS